jgi:hypothetical protein
MAENMIRVDVENRKYYISVVPTITEKVRIILLKKGFPVPFIKDFRQGFFFSRLVLKSGLDKEAFRRAWIASGHAIETTVYVFKNSHIHKIK